MGRIDSFEKTLMLEKIEGGRRKGTTEDETGGWHHQLTGHEFEQTPGVGDGQGGLACCSPWGHKESDTTEQLNWIELKHFFGINFLQFVGCLISGSMVGLMKTSSKRTYTTHSSSWNCCSQNPCPLAGFCWAMPLQETLNSQRQVWLRLLWGSLFISLGPDVHKVLLASSECLWWVWSLILKVISPLLLSCWGFSFALGHGISFFSRIQLSPVYGCSAVSCNFGVVTGEDEHMSFYSIRFRTY